MEISTCRFGLLAIEAEDLIHFPAGILGLEACQKWVLLADSQNEALGWLQSTQRPEIALGVASPRRFVPDYQIRIARRELGPLNLENIEEAKVLVIVSRNERAITLNLKAPLVFNLNERLAAQVVAKDDHPLQYELTTSSSLRRSA